MSYLERYVRGAQAQVWDELVAAGPRVREEPLAAHAWAVARETMRRVSRGKRCGACGTTATCCACACPPSVIPSAMAGSRRRTPRLPRGKRRCGRPPIRRSRSRSLTTWSAKLVRSRCRSMPSMRWSGYALVGGVNFVGTAPPDWGLDIHADPLYVYPITAALDEYAEWAEAAHREPAAARMGDLGPFPFRVPIAPAALHKYNISGGMWYHIRLPNAALDAHREAEPHATTFVQYLRSAFEWGGFPGLQFAPTCPEEVLMFLREGLLPM
jgi:hypothetical protein